jgi:hypothetical protein
MKFMTTWSAKPETLREAVGRFLAGQGMPAAGVTLLGRWHSADLSGGFSLFESDNPVAIYETSAVWADLLDMKIVPVVEDAEAGPILAKVLGK